MTIQTTLSKVKADAVEGVNMYKAIKSMAYVNRYGEHAEYVKATDTALGIVSWVQLIDDIRTKKSKKKIVANQLGLCGLMIAHNLCYVPEVRDVVKRIVK